MTFNISSLKLPKFTAMARTKAFDEQQVLDKALNLFWEKGYNGTSIQDLVDRLGINRASIYDTWGNKHQLYLASLTRYRQHASHWLLAQIRSDKPAREIIQSFLYNTIEQGVNDEKRKGCFVVNSCTELANQDIDVRGMVKENRETMEKVFSAIIQEGQETGEFNTAADSLTLSKYLYNTVTGLRVSMQGDSTIEELKAVADISLSTLLNTSNQTNS